MQSSAFGKGHDMCPHNCLYPINKLYRIMNLTAILLLVFCLQVSAKVSSQTITYTGRNVSLGKVFSVIREQTGYAVATTAKLVKAAKPVTIEAWAGTT